MYKANNTIITALILVSISTESFTKLFNTDCKINTEIITIIKAPKI